MPTATQEYKENLRFFAGLANQAPGFKLEFNRASGRFGLVRSTTVGRSLENAWKTVTKRADEKQSIHNDAMFSDPIRQVFEEAKRVGGEENARLMRDALKGLTSLEKAYRNTTNRLNVLKGLLGELARTVAPDRPEILELYLALDRRTEVDRFLFQGETDRKSLEKLFHDADVQRTLREAEDGVAGTDGNDLPATLKSLFYKKYNEASFGRDHWMTAEQFAGLLPHRPGVQLQGRDLVLGDAGAMKKAIQENPWSFIYYSQDEDGRNELLERFGQEQLWRVYLNVRPTPQAIRPAMALLAGQAATAGTSGLVDFKIAGPSGLLTRSDKIVVYLRGRGQADRLAHLLCKREHRGWFQDPTPMFTMRVAPGIALGVEPSPVLTNFEKQSLFAREEVDGRKVVRPLTEAERVKEVKEAKRKSYGSIRAALLATATYYYLLNKSDKLIGEGADAFVRWVAVVFAYHMRKLHPDH